MIRILSKLAEISSLSYAVDKCIVLFRDTGVWHVKMSYSQYQHLEGERIKEIMKNVKLDDSDQLTLW